MLARRLQTSLNTTVLRKPVLANSCATTLGLTRSYARSRYTERNPGVGRSRDRPERLFNTHKPQDSSQNQDQRDFWSDLKQEPKSSVEESPLWEASQRSPSSNPEEGLQKLLLENDVLVVTRQIEMLNIFVGFEQTNRYVITNPEGEILGYVAEEPRGFFSMWSRQVFRTHRPFRALVMDSSGSPILWLRRPFSWLISRLFVQRLKDFDSYTPEGEPVLDTLGEAHQKWHLWRRRYELFLRDTPHRILSLASENQPEPTPEEASFSQFANIDEGLLAWAFKFRDARGEEIASVDRSFRGVGRELFTDTGRYVIRFGQAPPDPHDPTSRQPSIIRNLTLDERALVLAMAVNIDFDYFSRHSGNGGWGLPLFFFAAAD
ncbi:Scramblase-domain-containing protein [Irpex rosettiformis]|uniref:Scramblase-domain-containing protein n=1 Tax=Irpex rosettiformis TaxID=378272 RepID=A0ACB8UGS5_9APHY|nr:Scramblase-domain-containing protein [Irpex rosettiformis]